MRSPTNSRTKTKQLAQREVAAGTQIIHGYLAENWDGRSQITKVRLVAGGPAVTARVSLAGVALYSTVSEGTSCTLRMTRGILEITAIDSTQQQNFLNIVMRGTYLRHSVNTTLTTGVAAPFPTGVVIQNDLGTVLNSATAAFGSGGTVSKTAGNATITGSGTSFMVDVTPGTLIRIAGGGGTDYAVVTGIASNTSMTVRPAPAFTASGQTPEVSTHGIPIPFTGWYIWSFSCLFNAANSTGVRRVEIQRNGLDIAFLRRAAANTSEYIQGSGIMYATQYDLFQPIAFQDSGANATIDAINEYSPTFGILSAAGN